MTATRSTIAGQLAAQLGGTAEHNEWYSTIGLPGGGRIRVTVNSSANGQLVLRGLFPDGYREHVPEGRISEPAIGVSAGKSAAVIARDIQRRLLPDYQAGLDWVAAQMAAVAGFDAGQAALLARLREAAGPIVDRHALAAAGDAFAIKVNGTAGTITAGRGQREGTANIDLHGVPAGLAADLVRALYKAAVTG
jgi:hypothetical protein